MDQKPNQSDAEGRLQGIWEDYYKDGTLSWRGHYHHGRLKGIDKWWNPQGDIHRKDTINVGH
jgi:antitoxin component YwqK of YwqJK toxin-antitoxin module